MQNLTRRTLLETGSIAAGAATLGILTSSKEVLAEPPSAGVFHVFAFQWKPGTTEDQKARAARDIRAFQGVIPGLLETHVGNNISPHGAGYTFGGIMRFKDKTSLDAYILHPKHQELLTWLRPIIDPVELDIVI